MVSPLCSSCSTLYLSLSLSAFHFSSFRLLLLAFPRQVLPGNTFLPLLAAASSRHIFSVHSARHYGSGHSLPVAFSPQNSLSPPCGPLHLWRAAGGSRSRLSFSLPGSSHAQNPSPCLILWWRKRFLCPFLHFFRLPPFFFVCHKRDCFFFVHFCFSETWKM